LTIAIVFNDSVRAVNEVKPARSGSKAEVHVLSDVAPARVESTHLGKRVR
jgi:hypothetical protein